MTFEKHFSTNLVKALFAEAFLLVGTLALLTFFTMGSAMAQDFPPQGGPGGGQFTARCPAGQYLIGTNAHYGFVVDHISLICGTINSDGTISNIWQDKVIYGGNGGSPVPTTSCAASEIIHGVGLLTGDASGDKVIRLMVFNCVSTTSDARHNLDIGVAPLFPTIPQNCKTG